MYKINPKDIKGKIGFKNVNFSCSTKPNPIILKDLNFVIETCQHILFIGNGKNTTLELLERFYDIEDGNGEILIDDINIKEYNLYELRKRIGIINKNTLIFKRSLLDNIRYGKLDATYEDCENAAKEANIKLDKKKEEISKEEKLSVDIARNFLKNPKIILIDELNSNINKDTELNIKKSLDKLIKDRTSIEFTNKLSNIDKYDKIFVLEKGRIARSSSFFVIIYSYYF